MLCSDSSNRLLCSLLHPNMTLASVSHSSLPLSPRVCAGSFIWSLHLSPRVCAGSFIRSLHLSPRVCVGSFIRSLHSVEVCAGKYTPARFLLVKDMLWRHQRSTLVVVWSKAPYIMISSLFDFVQEFLEMGEHFTLLPHREYPGVPREVIDKRHIVPETTKCCRLEWSPYIWIYYIQDPFARVPLL